MKRAGMGRIVRAVLAAALTTVMAAPAAAQRVTVELRGGVAIGNYTETGAGLELVPAPSFAATAELKFTDAVSGYVGIHRTAFGCDEGFCTGRDLSLASQGGAAGVRLTEGLFWGRAGLAVQVLRQSSDAQTETSDPGIGWDLAAGVEVPVGRGFLVRPGLTYLRHQVPIDGVDVDAHAAVLALEVGIARRF